MSFSKVQSFMRKRLKGIIASLVLTVTVLGQSNVVYAVENGNKEGIALEDFLSEDYLLEEDFNSEEDQEQAFDEELNDEDLLEELLLEEDPEDSDQEFSERLPIEEEPGDISENSSEVSEDPEDISGNSEDIFGNSEDISGNSGDVSGNSNESTSAPKKVYEKINKVSLPDTGSNILATKSVGDLKSSIEIKATTDKEGTLSWSSSNKKIATITGKGNTATLTAVKPGEVTVTVKSTDGNNKFARKTYRVIRPVDSIAVKGSSYVSPGESVKFSAAASPKNATEKSVIWTLSNAPSGVSLDPKTGKLTADKGAVAGATFTVYATATDGSKIRGQREVTISSKAKKVTLTNPGATTIATKENKAYKQTATLSASTDNGETVAWKASNSKIAVIAPNGNKCTVTAKAPGTVTVTAYANDGSGKKATAKIKVVCPVESMSITGQTYMAAGTNATYKAVITPSKATNSKVTWALAEKTEGISITAKSGMVEVGKNVPVGTKFIVMAKATDGSDVTAKKTVTVEKKATKVTIERPAVTTISTRAVTGSLTTSVTLTASANDTEQLSWKISNSKIATITADGNKATVKAVKPGEVTVTAFANDGSKKKATIAIKVIRPVDSIEITGQRYVSAGSSAKFTAKVLQEDAGNKNVNWSIVSAPKGVSIGQKSGVAQIDKNVAEGAEVKIRADAIDGSKVYATGTFTIKKKATRVTIDESRTIRIGTHDSGKIKNSITLKASTDNGETVRWEVDKKSSAALSVSGNSVTVTGLKPGKIKVTAYANDGSGLAASKEIDIIVPVSGISLVAEKDRMDDVLASGGSLQFYAKIGKQYGKPTNGKFKWSYELVCYTSKNKDKEVALSEELQKMIKKDKAILTFKDGKITAVPQEEFEVQWKKYWHKGAGKDYGIRVTATATDGTGLSVTRLVKRIDANKELYLSYKGNDSITVKVGEWTLLGYMIMTNHDLNDLVITNSNPDCVATSIESHEAGGMYFLHYRALKPGKSVVTIRTTDGSNLKCVFTITVVE